MNPSELREAIQNAYSWYVKDDGNGKSILSSHVDVDAILDAVIASLPKKFHHLTEAEINIGFNNAIDNVTELLQSAKSTSKESE